MHILNFYIITVDIAAVDVSGSFSALLHSSPVTPDVTHDVMNDVTHVNDVIYGVTDVTSAQYCPAEYDARRRVTELPVVQDATSLRSSSFCDLIQPPSDGASYSDNDQQLTAAAASWSSGGGIVTLMNSLAGPGAAEYPSTLLVVFVSRMHCT